MNSDNLVLLAGTGTRWLQLFVSLSLLIILHEFGHYFFAKRFKMRVEKFYLFFDFLFPFSGLFNFSLFKKKVGDTEYGVGWFPLGGYVKIAGMVDESMDKEELAQPPKPWEYRSKPAYMRLFTMLGGIIVNILVAMVIYMVIFGVWGEQYLPTENAKYGIMTDSVGKSLGFRNGDKVVGVNGQPVDRFNMISKAMFKGVSSVEIIRDGVPQSLKFEKEATKTAFLKNKGRVFDVRMPAVIDEVDEKMEAGRMKLMQGDSLIAINGKAVRFIDEAKESIEGLKNQQLHLVVMRKGVIVPIDGNIDSTGKLGIQWVGEIDRFFVTKTIHYNPVQAIAKGFTWTFQRFGDYVDNFMLLFDKRVKLSENLGGIGTFSKVFDTKFDMHEFLEMTAFISIVLAFMNLLPIPGLDGGYVIFLAYEMITRRKVSDKVMEVATTIGLVLLLALMLYANGLDVFRWIKKH